MGEVSNTGSIDRETRTSVLSGVSEATRSERHQGNLGDPRLGWGKDQQETIPIRKRNGIDEAGSRIPS